MLALVLLFVTSIFLAARSSFNLILLLLFLLVALAIWLGLDKYLNDKLKNNLPQLRKSLVKVLGKISLSSLFIISIFLAESTSGFPEWLAYKDIEMVSFFIILYLPLVILNQISYKVSIYLTIFFLLLSPAYLLKENELGANYTAAIAFLFLFFTFFQRLAKSDE